VLLVKCPRELLKSSGLQGNSSILSSQNIVKSRIFIKTTKVAIAVLSLTILVNCGGETTSTSESAASVTNNSPTLSAISDQTTAQNTSKTVSINASDSDGDSLTYALTSSPANTVTGNVSGSILTLIPESTFTGTAALTLQVSDGKNDASQTFSLIVTAPDPLSSHQWHIDNTGGNNYANNPGTVGKDINVDSVFSAGYTGDNIIIAIVDTGLEIAHEDLSVNVITNGSWDFVQSDSDPTNSATNGDHGTSVAGLAAAVGSNGKGGRGVAPKASLKGFNTLRAQNNANWISSLGGASYASNVDIFNQSYGISLNINSTINTYVEAQLLSGVTNLRSNKGAIYIKSAGNGFFKVKLSGVNIYCSSSGLYGASTGVTCQNANMDPENTVPYNIVVGALTATGVKSSYSTAGSSLWVAAPGGEYGVTNPAMMTVDQSGCSKGYVRSGNSPANLFDTVTSGVGYSLGGNASCNYTSSFNGTSSAAPILSGVVALILESNPALTWRDVKHILASTAVQVDSSISDVVLSINGVNHVSEPNWLTNAAGYKFHNYYGFGGVDVASAVTAAKAYTAGSLSSFYTSAWISSNTINVTIPNNSATGVSHDIAVSDAKVIESIQVRVNVTHESSGLLAVELTSPSGTKSVLMNPLNIFHDSDDLTNMVLLSNAFYGESSNGDWTLKVVDTKAGNAGNLNDWSIRIFGH